jgi:TonB family protein
MFGIGSLMLASVIAAAPASPLPWYNFDDYPQKAFDREWKGTAIFEVLVTPEGKPADCKITLSTGYEILDKQTCFVAMKRARFSAARGPDGFPAYGTYRGLVKWHRPDQENLQGEPGPDLEIKLASLPPGYTTPPAVKLSYFVDAQGNPSNCTVLPESLPQPQSLLDAACSELFSKIPRAPVTANAGPVPAVKTAAVLFSVDK